MVNMASNMDDLDIPIAFRRGKRRSSAVSPARASTSNEANPKNACVTPSRTRNKKRVRFSAPDQYTLTPSNNTSGLTPYVGRATLKTPRRAASTPNFASLTSGQVQFTPLRQALDDRTKRRIRRNGLSEEYNRWESDKKNNKELRKELAEKDEATQKLINEKDAELQRLKEELLALKSSGTSDVPAEEALSFSQKTVESEIETLRQSFNGQAPADFEEGDLDINWDDVRMHKNVSQGIGPASDGDDTIPLYDDNDDAVMFDGPSTPTAARVSQATMTHVDTMSDAELLTMALEVESAKKEKSRLFQEVRSYMASNPTGDDSPLRLSLEGSQEMPGAGEPHPPSLSDSINSLPSPPKDFYSNLSKTLKSTTHRAETAELALHALESDLRDLGFTAEGSNSPDSTSVASVVETIRSHFRRARLEIERILPGETSSGLNDFASLLPDCISKLKLLATQVDSRAAEFRSMHDLHRNLKVNFECALEAAEKANRRIKELEDAIEESAEDMLNTRMKLQAAEKETAEKGHTVTTLISALDKYRGDVSRLEALVLELESSQASKAPEDQEPNLQMIADLKGQVAAEGFARERAEATSAERAAQITQLQTLLETTQRDASQLQAQVSSLSAQKAASESSLQNTASQNALVEYQRNLQLAALNTRNSNLSTALTASEAERDRLDALVKRLRERIEITKHERDRYVEGSWNEIIRSATKQGEERKRMMRGSKVREANWALEDEAEEERASGSEGPMTPNSLVRFVDVDANEQDSAVEESGSDIEGRVEIQRGRARNRSLSGLGLEMGAKMGKGKKVQGKNRRSWDSGIGMTPVSEAAEDDEMVSGGSSDADADLLSSDSGFDIHEDAPEDSSLPTPEPSSELDTPQAGM